MVPDMNRLTQVLVASIPLLLTIVIFFMLMEGILNAGGGEKDILLTFPLLIWSLIFAISSIIFIIQGKRFSDWWRRALAISLSIMAVLFVMLIIAGFFWRF